MNLDDRLRAANQRRLEAVTQSLAETGRLDQLPDNDKQGYGRPLILAAAAAVVVLVTAAALINTLGGDGPTNVAATDDASSTTSSDGFDDQSTSSLPATSSTTNGTSSPESSEDVEVTQPSQPTSSSPTSSSPVTTASTTAPTTATTSTGPSSSASTVSTSQPATSSTVVSPTTEAPSDGVANSVCGTGYRAPLERAALRYLSAETGWQRIFDLVDEQDGPYYFEAWEPDYPGTVTVELLLIDPVLATEIRVAQDPYTATSGSIDITVAGVEESITLSGVGGWRSYVLPAPTVIDRFTISRNQSTENIMEVLVCVAAP